MEIKLSRLSKWLLSLELKFWKWRRQLRHPFLTYRDWRHWQKRPMVDDVVEDCRGKRLRVIAIGINGDDLTFEDGTHASWTHCCDWPKGNFGG